nr:MAG TPA: hypothetical protein [Caudoviricetes sp.]
MRRVNFDLLASALTIVIADMIIKPKIEVNDGEVKIVYERFGTTFTETTTTFEVNHCMRLDFLIDKIRLSAKYSIYNNATMRYKCAKL